MSLKNIRVVLVSPIYSGNVGSVCRAMKNMGISDLAVAARDADVEDHSTGLDVLGRDQARHPGRGDDDVGAAQVLRQVPRPGVGERHRRVVLAAGEQQRDYKDEMRGKTNRDDEDVIRKQD